ncbi:MAG TPA: hypothetical protein VFT72_00175 [Opitutaceae bacterium]|nr:hypothetical protein [Opitutaceae bacterium]
MPLNPRIAALYNVVLQPRDPVPLIRGWNRLEGRPRSADFERSLRAEVRDPLWFLTRRWQFGEFQGEDAGSPIDARLAYQSGTLDSFQAGEQNLSYDPRIPLETRVEAEAPIFDLTLHMQAARVFERALQAKGRAARIADYATHVSLDYAADVAGQDTPEAAALFASGHGFLFDAQKLIAAVRDGTHANLISSFSGMTSDESTDLLAAGTSLVAWFETVYGPPSGEGASATWQPDRLDYAFSAGASAAGVHVTANTYDGSEVDWHSFDVKIDAPSSSPTTQPSPLSAPVALSFLPSSIRFSGMPSPRYWEMEDSRTDFGAIDANTNDLAKLLLTEFMLLYSNDWCVVPLELPVGSFTRVQGLVVTDVFGDQTFVRAADRGSDGDWERWSMYRLNGDTTSAMGLFLPPALTAKASGPAFEDVYFLRDEMANLVWGVEARLPSKLGEPLNPEIGYTAPSPPASTAETRYALGTTVPPNWRPFLPTHLPDSTRSIRLQRGRLPSQPAQPLGTILNPASPYFIAEEEIPRAGRIVQRAYQRARWIDGSTFLWIGRLSILGRGEGLSGLVFDQIQETPKPEA